MPDESDRIFYDAAKAVNAYLVTGNQKHYPENTQIVTPARFEKFSERVGDFTIIS